MKLKEFIGALGKLARERPELMEGELSDADLDQLHHMIGRILCEAVDAADAKDREVDRGEH